MTRNILRFSLVLGIIAIVFAFGLALVFQVTRVRIEEKDRLVFEAALKSVFPDATACTPLSASDAEAQRWDQTGVAKAVKGAQVLGYLCIGEKQGYSSKIRVLVGCDTSYAIKAVQILFAAETPGLGERIKEVKSDQTLWQAMGRALGLSRGSSTSGAGAPWFQVQFAGKTLEQLAVVKGESEDKIQAITAATITSNAVTEAVKSALQEIRKATAAGGRENAE